jgi:hypothetical protein
MSALSPVLNFSSWHEVPFTLQFESNKNAVVKAGLPGSS